MTIVKLTHWDGEKLATILMTFKFISLNENHCILNQISSRVVTLGPIDNISVLVQIMPWCRLGHKPLSEPMMAYLVTHISFIRPQWIDIGSRWCWSAYEHTNTISCWRILWESQVKKYSTVNMIVVRTNILIVCSNCFILDIGVSPSI